MTIKLNFDGLLQSPASWAKVNRKILAALTREDRIRLAVQPRRGFQWQSDFPLPDELQTEPTAFDDPDAKLTFSFPPKLSRDKQPGVPLLVHSLYEATRLPESWVEPLRTVPDRILVPSEHVRRIYENHDVPSTKLRVLPYGYDPSIYKPEGESGGASGSTKLLSVATPHFRKGLDLLRSVTDVANQPGLTWRVHFPFTTKENPDDFWIDPWIQQDLAERGFTVTTGCREEATLAETYRTTDLCVQPSRSEGFGLVILEAMASGTPVLTTNWGGHKTFEGPGMIRVDGSLRPAGRCQYHQRQPGSRVFEPDPVAFRSMLRELVNAPDRLEALGTEARQSVDAMTWERTAGRLIDVLENCES